MASKLGVTALYVTPTQESGGPLTPRTPQDRRHWSCRIICMYLLLTFKLFYSYVVHCPLCLKDHSLRRTNSAVISCRKEEERE